MHVIQENKHVSEKLFSLDSTDRMRIFITDQDESGIRIEDFIIKHLIKR